MRKSSGHNWRRPHKSRGRASRSRDLFTFAAGATTGGLCLLLGGRPLIKYLFRKSLDTVLTDPYERNLLELYSATSRYGLQRLLETELRASQGTVIQRPFGSAKHFPDFEQLMFNIAQLETMPIGPTVPIDLAVTIGPRAKRPLGIEIPIIISGMAYGVALSEAIKVALAKGASQAGTASNTGGGPWLESERRAAKKLIYQYHRGHWDKSERIPHQVDAIEISIGQGAAAGLGFELPAALLDDRLQRQFEVEPGQPVQVGARNPEVRRPEDLAQLVNRLRKQSDGVPIGVKLGAGLQLEQDMQHALQADVDFIAIDGANAASKGAPPLIEDDFGLPTIFALLRAVRYLEQQGARGKVSLIISGGLRTPGDFLKALALGADAVYIGTAALYAVSHTQVDKVMPFEPPTQLAWYHGSAASAYDPEQGALSLQRYLTSCADEMREGVRALGKHQLADVNRDDLCALDQATADICGLPFACPQ